MKIKIYFSLVLALVVTSANLYAKSKSSTKSSSIVQPIENILGSWDGFMYCTNYNYLFDLKISRVTGNQIAGSFSAKLRGFSTGDKPRGSAYPKVLKANLKGQFFPELSSFMLRVERAPRGKGFSFKGLLDPTVSRFAAEILMPHYGQCSFALAGKKGISKIIKKIDKASHFMPKLFGRPAGTDKCDGPMGKWVKANQSMMGFSVRNYRDPALKNRIKYTALEMLQDKHFKPYFGKSFMKISPKQMGAFYHQLANGCSREVRSGSAQQQVFRHIFRVVQNQKELPRSELVMYPYIKTVLSNWKKTAVSELPSLSSAEAQQLSVVADSMLSPLWPIENGNIRDDVIQAVQNASGNQMLVELKQLISQRPMTFQRLAELTRFATTKQPKNSAVSLTSNPAQQSKRQIRGQGGRYSTPANQPRASRRQVRQGQRLQAKAGVSSQSQKQAETLIQKTVNQHTVEASKLYAASISTPASVTDNLSPLNNSHYNTFVKYLDAPKVVEVNQIFRQRKTVLLNEYINNEQQKYTAIEQEIFNLNQLQRLNSYEVRLKQNYSSLLLDPLFRSFNQIRMKNRQAQLANNSDNVGKQFSTRSNLASLEQSLSVMVLEEDRKSPSGRVVMNFYKVNRSRISPFIDLVGGEYLDAIYHGDFASVRSQDKTNARKIIKQFDDTMRGLAPGTKNPYSLQGIENKMTLVKPLAATYLFSYQGYSKRCLSDDHAVFKVTKTVPDVVTSNLLGVEISRLYGYSTETDYSVNKEFTGLFRIVGNSEPNSFSAGIVDNFLGTGKMGNVIRGTKSIMRQFDCNSPQIKQFERNLRIHAMQRLR